jgi:hypothetical protein
MSHRGRPVLRSPILVVGRLDREPGDHGVRVALASWQEQFARLRPRLVTGDIGLE